MQTTKLVQATRQDDQGYMIGDKRYYSHTITVDGVDYFYTSVSKELTNFEAGKEATFTTEEKTMKNGKTRLTISPVRENKWSGGGGKSSGGFKGGNNYSKDDAQIAMLSCISSSATYHQGRSTPTFELVMQDALKAYELVRSKRGDFN